MGHKEESSERPRELLPSLLVLCLLLCGIVIKSTTRINTVIEVVPSTQYGRDNNEELINGEVRGEVSNLTDPAGGAKDYKPFHA